MGKLVDLTNKQFGRLTVLKRSDIQKKGKSFWDCQCLCGKKTRVDAYSLKTGVSKSCGCLQREISAKGKHGGSKVGKTEKLYGVWKGLRARCNNKNNPQYHNYGGRGIKVCNEWKSNYATFREWASTNGYKEGLSIDRIDNNGNYEPSNCRWTDNKTQCNNTRRNHLLTFNGETKTLAEWADENKLTQNILYKRIFWYNWPVEIALKTPLDIKYRRRNVFITYNGVTKTMKEWAQEYGISLTTLHYRIKKYKWSPEKALTEPVNTSRRNKRAKTA